MAYICNQGSIPKWKTDGNMQKIMTGHWIKKTKKILYCVVHTLDHPIMLNRMNRYIMQVQNEPPIGPLVEDITY